MVNVTLSKDSVIRVTGPARVDVKKGKVLMVGATYYEGSSVVIHSLRSYGIKALEDSELSITLGSGASVEEPSRDEEVIDSWLNVCKVLEKDIQVLNKLLIIVLGPIESGKTTLTAFISNYFLQRNKKVGIIDADVGQEDIAIPTTIALAEPKEVFVWQRALSPLKMKFIGCIAPQYCQNSILAALKELVSESREMFDVTIINTDGWISTHQALEFKLNIIRWIKPTHVLVLDHDIWRYISKSLTPKIKVLNIPRPLKVKERSRDERRRLRSESYRKYFSNASEREVSISEVKLIGSCIFSGDELDPSKLLEFVKIPKEILSDVLYASKYFNIINLVINRRDYTPSQKLEVQGGIEVNIVRPNDYEGLLVGILDDKLNDVAVGVIKHVDFANKRMRILTPWSGEIGAVVLGRVKVSLGTFEDTAKIGRCVL